MVPCCTEQHRCEPGPSAFTVYVDSNSHSLMTSVCEEDPTNSTARALCKEHPNLTSRRTCYVVSEIAVLELQPADCSLQVLVAEGILKPQGLDLYLDHGSTLAMWASP